MPDRSDRVSEQQAAQHELLERARALPGVADLVEIYGNLLGHMNLVVNVWPGQAQDATGGNVG
jgi:hypothetical protein